MGYLHHKALTIFLENNIENISRMIMGDEESKHIIFEKMPTQLIPPFNGVYLDLKKITSGVHELDKIIILVSQYIRNEEYIKYTIK